MPQHARRPTPINHSYRSGGYNGEICPICGKNKLGHLLKFPVCHRCREICGLTEGQLKKLDAHRLIISQDLIDWQQEPAPTIDGQIDGLHWQASLKDGLWQTKITEETEGAAVLCQLVDKYINAANTIWQKKVESGKSAIRRYAFFVACGAVVVTGAMLLKSHRDQKQRELRESEEALREDEK